MDGRLTGRGLRGFCHVLGVVALAFVFFLVVADPTPNFLGMAPDTESPEQAIPSGSVPTDFMAPVLQQPRVATHSCGETTLAALPAAPVAFDPPRLSPLAGAARPDRSSSELVPPSRPQPLRL